jgi:hypothetical protein
MVNRRCNELFGRPMVDVIGKTDYDLCPKEAADTYRAHDLEVLSAGAPLEWEETASWPDGVHTYLAVKVPLRDASGVPYGLCGISTDITHRTKAEQERARLLREAQEALELRDEFLAIASHELRTPLTPLRLNMQLLQRHLQDPTLAAHPKTQSFHRLLEISSQQQERLSKLVEDLLDVSRISAGQLALHLTDVDLSALVRRSAQRSARRALGPGPWHRHPEGGAGPDLRSLRARGLDPELRGPRPWPLYHPPDRRGARRDRPCDQRAGPRRDVHSRAACRRVSPLAEEGKSPGRAAPWPCQVAYFPMKSINQFMAGRGVVFLIKPVFGFQVEP